MSIRFPNPKWKLRYTANASAYIHARNAEGGSPKANLPATKGFAICVFRKL